MKKILLFILFPFILFGQSQLGSDIDGEATDDQSGISVTLSSDGSILAIGAYLNDGVNGSDSGHVRVYSWNGSAWVQKGSDINGEVVGERSGINISLSSNGNILAIGAYFNSENATQIGQVRVYIWNGSAWVQMGSDINGEAANDKSGINISLSSNGNTLAIGAPINDGVNGASSGHVRVYIWNGSAWVQMGLDIDGEVANDQSGINISLSSNGNTLAIGAPTNDGVNGSDSGHVRVYIWNGSAWVQMGLDIDGEVAGDRSGDRVSLSSDGNVVAIASTLNNGVNGTDSGHVRVYIWNGSAWVQMGSDIDGEAANDRSGVSISLSLDGNILAIGAPLNTGVNGTQSGHVRVYSWNGSIWVKLGIDIDGEAASDFLGWSVSLSSDANTLAIGAPFNDGVNGSNSGHVRVYDLSALLSRNSFVLSQFNIYPNPVKDQFTIKLQQGLELQKVNIYNSLGQLISSTSKRIVDTKGLSSGLYYVEVITNQGKATKKIVVE